MGNVKNSVAERTRHQRYNGTESEVQDESSMSGNDTDTDDADIRPIYDEEPMDEEQITAKCDIFAIGQQHTEQPEIINEGRVDQYLEQRQVKSLMLDSSPDNQTTDYSKQSLESENILLKMTVAQFQNDFSRMEAHCIALELKYQNHALKSGQHGQILNEASNKAKMKKEIDAYETINIELDHKVATLVKENETLKRKLLDSCTSKVDSELPNGSNVDISKIHECKQTLDFSAGKYQSVVAEKADISKTSVTSWKVYSVFDEYFNGENQVVSKSFAVPTSDASDKCQQQPDLTSSTASTSTLATTVTAYKNFDLCQETMGDTIAQTRFENVSTQSYDPLLARGNTLRSGEDSLKLKELMELCTNLQQRVLDLEKTKTTQAEEIVSLKRRVKKLEQKKRSRTHMLKRLRKVGATARVESSGGEESLGEDASKQGRIDAIDADDDITLVSVHDVNVSAGKEEVVEVINTAKLIIDAAQVSAAGDKVSTADAATTVSVATTTITTVKEITLAQALANLKSIKPKAKGIAFREPDQLKLDEEITLKLQEEIDKEKRIARAEEKKIDEANISCDGIHAKVDADYQLAERLQAEE
ncbi:hypothetical protein Tco_0859392 [Tanacetum coccineum]|uniref:Uncharacterized protein n=1 Tax=Tanacetum coccineum TaxID=301880 RepID=A0ABQ5BBZ2_9ASTR